MSFLRAHARQILVLSLSITVATLVYFRPDLRPVLAVSVAVLAAAGLQLPPFVLGAGGPPSEQADPSMLPANRPAPRPPIVPPMPVLFALSVLVLSSCAAGAANLAYDQDLAKCELAPTCAAAVLCRARAAEAHGRTYNGSCVTVTDGGAE